MERAFKFLLAINQRPWAHPHQLVQMVHYEVTVFWPAPQVSMVACHIRPEPFGVGQQVGLLDAYFGLYVEMALLAECSQVPPGAVRRVHVNVVDGQGMTGCRIVRVATAHALPVGSIFAGRGDRWPVGWVVTAM